MEHPLWEVAKLEAEYEHERKLAQSMRLSPGDKIPQELLEQAILLTMAGWKLKDIAEAVGRSTRAVRGWRKTAAWLQLREKLLVDKLKMHLLDQGVTLRHILEESLYRHLQ